MDILNFLSSDGSILSELLNTYGTLKHMCNRLHYV